MHFSYKFLIEGMIIYTVYLYKYLFQIYPRKLGVIERLNYLFRNN